MDLIRCTHYRRSVQLCASSSSVAETACTGKSTRDPSLSGQGVRTGTISTQAGRLHHVQPGRAAEVDMGTKHNVLGHRRRGTESSSLYWTEIASYYHMSVCWRLYSAPGYHKPCARRVVSTSSTNYVMTSEPSSFVVYCGLHWEDGTRQIGTKTTTIYRSQLVGEQ